MRTGSQRTIACVVAALALVLTSCTSTPSTGPSQAPGPSDVKLDGWQLTLPVANPDSGDEIGRAHV